MRKEPWRKPEQRAGLGGVDGLISSAFLLSRGLRAAEPPGKLAEQAVEIARLLIGLIGAASKATKSGGPQADSIGQQTHSWPRRNRPPAYTREPEAELTAPGAGEGGRGIRCPIVVASVVSTQHLLLQKSGAKQKARRPDRM